MTRAELLESVQEAAIAFLAAWRAPIGASPRGWLARSDKAEQALEDALVASGVNPAAIRARRRPCDCA